MSGARRAVIFDLDGTLLDTLRDLADAGNAVLRDRGFPIHEVEAYRTFIGAGMETLVRRIFPEAHRPATEAEIAAVLADYRDSYGRHWDRTTEPYPGIPALLDALEERTVPRGVLSNKAHDFTVKCIDTFLGGWRWDVVLGQRDGVEKKPHPGAAVAAARELRAAPRDCLFVGDSDVDMQTAANAGMRAVGVNWGFRSAEELRSAGAEVVLEEPGELLDWL